MTTTDPEEPLEASKTHRIKALTASNRRLKYRIDQALAVARNVPSSGPRTHNESCWMGHADCLAARIRDALEITPKEDQ